MANSNVVWTDLQALDVLDLIERQGQTATLVAARYGVSRSSVLGLVHRIRMDLAKSEIGPAASRPENRDGAMGPRWWEAASARRRGMRA